jgi:DNA-binding SARP family transcriptional activator
MSLAFNGHDIKIKSRKSRAVLAFVALSESRQETRERLVGMFWSESEEHKARASLRQTLRDLRQSLFEAGYHGLQTEKLAIELDPQSVEVDLLAVIDDAENHRVHPLLLNVPRLAETLLAGFEDIDPEFRVWLLAKRQTFHARMQRGLETGLNGEHDVRSKKRLAEAIINLDPTHEEACRWLMRLRAEEGDVAGALGSYNALWKMLDDEYDMEPSQSTQELVAKIKTGEIGFIAEAAVATPIRTTASSEAKHDAPAKVAARIALLFGTFGMNGVGEDKVHLVHGFRHHLIACLVRFREWSVADSAMQSPGATQSSSFSAQYAVDATAYQAGATVSLVLTLRESISNVYIWSEAFELRVENWFETQHRIVRRIASSLNVQLSAERLRQLATEPDVSLEVYDRWLRGQSMILRFNPDGWKRAAQIFADGIQDAPNFSSCYSSLVQLNNTVHIAHPGILRDPEKASETIELARTAVQLDPVDSRAQLCLGWSYAMAKQYAQAEVHMDLACELNENDEWTLISSALFYAFCAKFDRAEQLAAQARGMTFAPSMTHWAYLVSIRFLCGDYQGTIEAANHAMDIIKTMPAWKAAALYRLGRSEEAAREAERFLAGIRSNWQGSEPPTKEAIGRWLLHLYPISSRAHWERLRDAVAGAGIPVVGLDHHAW